MTKSQLERTKWAKDFKRECPGSSYDMAIKYVLDGAEFDIHKSNERDGLVYEFVIMPTCDFNFWMACFKTHRAAVAFCRKMGWRLEK